MKYLFILSFIVFIGCNANQQQSQPEEPIAKTSDAETLFKNTCAQCHKCDAEFTGPALRGSWDRWPDKKLLFEFIRNSQEVIAKDAYAKELFKKYNQTYMNPYPQLTDAEIQSLLDYCK